LQPSALSIPLAALALLGLHVAPAAACGASPPPHYAVAGEFPASGSAPLNAPLLIALVDLRDGVQTTPFVPQLVLTEAGSQAPIAVGPANSFLSPTELSFVPQQPLSPTTKYRATFDAGQSLDGSTAPGASGSVSWEFTTGEALVPTLALDGALQVTLEAGEDPIQDCGLCGGCVETGKLPVTKARVVLPKLVGGFAGVDTAVQGKLVLTNDAPADLPELTPNPTSHSLVRSERAVALSATGPSFTLISLPVEEVAYRPCFAFSVTDARGDVALAQPICLPDAFPNTDVTPAAGGAAAGDEPAPASDTAAPPRTSKGCSATPSPSGSVSSLASLLALLGGAASRRRRSKTAL
jgi:MYXO-CTERM domain-containing protein